MPSKYGMIGDVDKPFHFPECVCNQCEEWRSQQPEYKMATRHGYDIGKELVEKHGWEWVNTALYPDHVGDRWVVDPLTGKAFNPYRAESIQKNRDAKKVVDAIGTPVDGKELRAIIVTRCIPPEELDTDDRH